MKNEKDTSKQLLFLEPVNKDSNEDELLRRLVVRLESLGFNIIGRQKEQKMKIKWVEPKEDDPIFKNGFIISPMKSQSPKKTFQNTNKKRRIEKEESKKKGD